MPMVSIGTRIDQNFSAGCIQGKRQGVSVAVRCDGPIAEGARIGEKPDLLVRFPATAEEIIAPLRECTPDR